MSVKLNIHTIEGPALDWVVSQCEEKKKQSELKGSNILKYAGSNFYGVLESNTKSKPCALENWSPSSNEEQANEIIEREQIQLNEVDGQWVGIIQHPQNAQHVVAMHSSRSVAALRAYAISVMGVQVEVPKIAAAAEEQFFEAKLAFAYLTATFGDPDEIMDQMRMKD